MKNNNYKSRNVQEFGHLPEKSISWRAIFAGTVTVFAILLVLNLIGIAIGFSTIEPTEESNPLSGIGTGAVIWWIVSNLFAIFLGASVASRAGVSFTDKGGIMQGFLTWALYGILSYFIIASAVGKIISGVGNVISTTAVETGKAMMGQNSQNGSMQMSDINWKEAKDEFFALLEDTEKKALDPERLESQANEVRTSAEKQAKAVAKDPTKANEDVNKVFDKAEREFAKSIDALDRDALVNVIVNRSNLSREEANETVDNYMDTYKEVKKEAKAFMESAKEEINETAEAAAEAAAKAALYVALALILGLVAAIFGGLLGVRSLRNDYKDQLNTEENFN